jgi:starch-binding outer membrane protein, SusD/RagB family
MRTHGFSRAAATVRVALIGIWAAALPACSLDDALEVEAPSQVPADLLDAPEHAALLVNGAIGDFECAFNGYIVNGGMLTDELDDATFTVARWPVHQRSVSPSDGIYATSSCAGIGVYTPVSTARWSADNVLAKLDAWTDAEVPDRQSLIATAAAYSGYSHLLLAEGFCTIAIDLSAELTPQEVFTRAEAKFTRAIEAAQAAGNDDILNMARVGRARARLNLGQLAEAAADARLVPEGFVKVATASITEQRRRNRVAEENRSGVARVSVDSAFFGLTVGGQPETRVRVADGGRFAVDAETRLLVQQKYAEPSTAIPIASWDEAQLIIAEAEGGAEAVAAINRLRDNADLPAYGGGSAAEITAQVREERRRELFLESHRLGDVRRWSLSLPPAAGTPYPKGGNYGDRQCLPLPDVERLANPNIGA